MPGPIFVSFEGGEGSGKSTQAEILLERFVYQGTKAVLVHEPGTTPLGLHLRDYLKSERPLSKEAELLLFEAARADLVVNEVKPALGKGIAVIADRFEASSIAYQGYGRNIDLDVVERLNSFAVQGTYPDLTFLLDVDPAEGLRRVGSPQLTMALIPDETSDIGRQDVAGHRRFEDQPLRFHERVRKGFLELARNSPERWVIIDATRPVEAVSEEIWSTVLERVE